MTDDPEMKSTTDEHELGNTRFLFLEVKGDSECSRQQGLRKYDVTKLRFRVNVTCSVGQKSRIQMKLCRALPRPHPDQCVGTTSFSLPLCSFFEEVGAKTSLHWRPPGPPVCQPGTRERQQTNPMSVQQVGPISPIGHSQLWVT